MKNIKEVDYRGKRLMVYDCSPSEHIISHVISSGAGWDNEVIDHVISFSDKSKNMIDIGGEIGSYTIALAEYFNTITTFEPNLENFNILSASLEKNNIQNVNLLNSAVGSEVGTCELVSPYKNIVDLQSGDTKISPLDDFQLTDCIFLKIDVEGHELEVLKGAKNTIIQNKPIIYLETHPTIRHNIDLECESLLHSYGYVETKEITKIDKFWEYNK